MAVTDNYSKSTNVSSTNSSCFSLQSNALPKQSKTALCLSVTNLLSPLSLECYTALNAPEGGKKRGKQANRELPTETDSQSTLTDT